MCVLGVIFTDSSCYSLFFRQITIRSYELRVQTKTNAFVTFDGFVKTEKKAVLDFLRLHFGLIVVHVVANLCVDTLCLCCCCRVVLSLPFDISF